MTDTTTPSVRVEHMLVGGRWEQADSGEVLETVNPTTEEVIAAVPAGGPADVDRAVRAAKRAAPGWSALPWTVRSQALTELASRLRDHADELALIDVDDAGLPLKGMRRDVAAAAAELEYFAGLGGELKGFTLPTKPGELAYTVREPYGVVGRIIPFNHPLMFAASRVAAPLMAGNCVVLKPPEQAPLSALALARLSEDLFPRGVFNVVTGLGTEVGGALAAHPDVPRIAFTGSVPTGRAVLRAAADHIKHVTLELGGKNPMIVCADADPAKAAAAAAIGMGLSATMGQSCQSNSRVFVHERIADEFVSALKSEVESLVLGDPRSADVDMGPLAYRAHHERVMEYIEMGMAEGATLVTGGGRPAGLDRGFYVAPTVFTNVAPEMRIATEEIFGPVVCVMPWSDEDELFQVVDGLDFGLTAKIWTRDIGRAQRFSSRVQSGLVWINGAGGTAPGTPIGGYKHSGLGKECCLEELISYTREKAVLSAPPSW